MSKVLFKEFNGVLPGVETYPMVSICIVTFQNKSLIQPELFYRFGPNATMNYHFAMSGKLDYEDNKLTQSLGFEDIAIDLQDYADSFEI